MNKNIKRVALATLLLITSVAAMADNGHQLWLRQTGLDNPACNVTQKAFNPTATDTESQTVRIAMSELLARISQKLNIQLEKRTDAPANDGFTISRRGSNITISSASGIGLLYGAFALIRMQQTDTHALGSGSITEIPASPLRILNHWDNLNGTIERGYAGRSIFWSDKGEIISQNAPLLVEYARANASIGINGTVLNNVNASPKVLTADYLKQTAHVARILRPYGIRVYLSINFASPKALGDLTTADPLDEDVAAWWKAKAKEIYDLIPDFGGFLVKANSEGEPGPGDYGRTHVEGANMLAAAVKPYGGIIMWRAFVYAANSPDRAKQAYEEFMPLDGQFADNVILQVKNGPVDFQPREPIHPLFLSMKKTPVMPEWQITQEYLGHSIHNVFLAPMWKEMLDDWRTYGTGANRSFADMKIPAIAGVSNIGNSVNWQRHGSSQLVRLRTSGMESRHFIGKNSTRIHQSDPHKRQESNGRHIRHHATFTRSLCELHDAYGPAPHLCRRTPLRSRTLVRPTRMARRLAPTLLPSCRLHRLGLQPYRPRRTLLGRPCRLQQRGAIPRAFAYII